MYFVLYLLGLVTLYVILNKNINEDVKLGYYITAGIIVVLYVIFGIIL